MSQPKLICFDLGGVVVRICRSWAEGCARVGLDVRGEGIDRIALSPDWRALNRVYQRGEIDGDEFCDRFSALVDGLYTPEEMRRVNDAWVFAEYDGVEELIHELRQDGHTTCALSNTCLEHLSVITEWPTMRAIEHLFASHEIGLVKPDVEAFVHVEEALGVDPADVIFFDDTAENIEAANARGWSAWQVDPAGDTAAFVRNVVMSSR